MANDVSAEAAIHQAIATAIQNIYDECGIQVTEIVADWQDDAYLGVKARCIALQVRTRYRPQNEEK